MIVLEVGLLAFGSMSSGSVSTVTRIFHGLRVCSVTVLEGETVLSHWPRLVLGGVALVDGAIL